MTLELYEALPEDLARQIEVSDGTIIVCHSPSKPTAADTLIAIEIVSPGSISDDLLVKRVRYARAGIGYYWIIRLAQNDGPAVSVELLRLTSDGTYAMEQVTFREEGHPRHRRHRPHRGHRDLGPTGRMALAERTCWAARITTRPTARRRPPLLRVDGNNGPVRSLKQI
jgi:hypothetical protein